MKKLFNFQQPLFIILASSLLLVLFWFKGGNILGGAEAELPFYKLDGFAKLTSWAWSESYLGFATGLTTASFPTWWFLAQIQSLGIPGFIIQAVLFWFLFFIAGVGIYQLVKLFFPGIPRKYLILAVFFYWFNPISFNNVWNRFLLNFIFFWSFLPLATFIFIKGLKTFNLRFAILVSLFTVCFSYVFSSVVFILLFWFWLLFIVLFFFTFYPGKRLFYLRYTLLTLFSFIVFHAWWISQYLSFILSSSLSVVVSEFFSTEGNLFTLSKLSEKLGQLIYVIRYLPGTTFNEKFGQTLFGIIPALNILQFFFPSVIFWAIYKFRKQREIILFSSLYFISLFLIKGDNYPFGELFQYAFVKLVALQAFRDPFEKFSFFLLLSSTIIFVFGIWKINQSARLQKINKIFYPASFIFILLVWGFPFYTGRVFTRVENIENKNLTSYEVKVPEYYKEANKWLNDQNNEFRFVSLPLGDEGMTYKWDKPYSGVEISRNLFDKPNVSFNTTIQFYRNLVSNLADYQINKSIFDYLPFIYSKYIVLRSDVDFKERNTADPSTVREKLETWVNEGQLSKKFERGGLSVYEVANLVTWPKVFITSNIFTSNQNDLAKIIKSDPNFVKDYLAVFNYKDSYVKSSGELIIRPTKTFLPNSAFVAKKFSDVDLMARLFHVEHLPTEKIYPLIRIKEEMQSPSKDDYLGWFLYQTGILGKRAVEVYKLYANIADPSLISKAESDYLTALRKFKPYLSSIIPNSSSVSDVTKDSLVYQLLLLNGYATDSLKKELSNVLLDFNIIYRFELPPTQNSNYIIYNLEIPKTGNYYLTLDKDLASRKWFVDGKEIGVLSAKELSGLEIYLEEGIHEMAVNVKEEDYLTNEINLGYISTTDKSNYSSVIDIPDIPTTFQISFDYLFKKGVGFQFLFEQDTDDPKDPILSKVIDKDLIYHGWLHHTVEYTTTAGSRFGTLRILPKEVKKCERVYWIRKLCWNDIEEYDIEIRNLRVRQLHYPQISLSSTSKITSQPSTTKWQWVKVNPTLYALKVNKIKPGREAIVFSELYDPNWKLYQVKSNNIWNESVFSNMWGDSAKEYRLNSFHHMLYQTYGGIPVEETKHHWTNLYANSWEIDKEGEYEYLLAFDPQQRYYLGTVVSILSILTALAYYIIKSKLWIKKIN